MTKTYDTKAALNPGQGDAKKDRDDVNYSDFVAELPEEFQQEVEEALAALLAYIHGEEGTTAILDALQNVDGDLPAEIGKQALMAMDSADPDHKWSESAKVLCGYFAVKEVSTIARAAKIIDIPEEKESEIFKVAAQNYIHFLIKSKPTQEERDSEAVRIQKEVEPLMDKEMKAKSLAVAKENGIPIDEAQARGQQPQQGSKQGGLLE